MFSDDELRALARRVSVAAGLDGPRRPGHGCDWIAVRTRHVLHLISPAVTRSGLPLGHAELTARARVDIDAVRAEYRLQDLPTPHLPRDGTIVLCARETGVVTAEGCDQAAEKVLARIGMRPVALPCDTPWMRTPYGTVLGALPGYAAHAQRVLTEHGYRVDRRTENPRPLARASAPHVGAARIDASAAVTPAPPPGTPPPAGRRR